MSDPKTTKMEALAEGMKEWLCSKGDGENGPTEVLGVIPTNADPMSLQFQ